MELRRRKEAQTKADKRSRETVTQQQERNDRETKVKAHSRNRGKIGKGGFSQSKYKIKGDS